MTIVAIPRHRIVKKEEVVNQNLSSFCAKSESWEHFTAPFLLGGLPYWKGPPHSPGAPENAVASGVDFGLSPGM